MIKSIAGILALSATLVSATRDETHTARFELHGNVAFVKASIAGSEPLDMVLDTGTIRTTLDEAVAVKLGLDLSMKALSSGANGKEEISILKGPILRICDVETSIPIMLSYPLDFLSKRIVRRVDGIIGIELFRKYIVDVDYPAQQVRVSVPEGFSYAGPGEIITVTYDRGLPIVAGSVIPYGHDPIPAKFQVDNGGASASVMFWKGFIEKHDLMEGAHEIKDVQVTGFTGTSTQKQGRIQAVQIGKMVVSEPMVGLNDYQLGDPNVFDANLGSGFLKQFRLIFDLPHDRIIFERPATR